MRLVSCVPSLSELIYYLDHDSLIGRTRFCIYPSKIKSVPVVGGTKNLDLNKIRNLQPDLIIGTKEENESSQFKELAKDFQTCVFEINTVENCISCISELGSILSSKAKAEILINDIRKARAEYRPGKTLTAIYLIWKKPWMTVGGDTFINAMMKEAGLINLYCEHQRYPGINLTEDINKLQPELILLSTEPFPFKLTDVKELEQRFPNSRVILADGTYFSWYGNRIKEAYSYFSKLLENQPQQELSGKKPPA